MVETRRMRFFRSLLLCVCACVRACVVCVRACAHVCVCVHACVHACERVCVYSGNISLAVSDMSDHVLKLRLMYGGNHECVVFQISATVCVCVCVCVCNVCVMCVCDVCV